MKIIHVAAAVIYHKNRILATQRGYGDFKDGWEFPGGKIREGETPQAALAREIREELDTEIAVESLIGEIEHDYPVFHLSMKCYWCRVVSGDLVLKEHEAARWLRLEELDSVNWLPADLQLLPLLRANWRPAGEKVIMETKRLILREYTPDDFNALYEMLSDPETMAHYPTPYDEAGTKRWLQWSLDNYVRYGFGLWALVLRETGAFIGDCGLTLQPIDGQTLPEIGYHIHKKYWRQGFAKEAARAVRDWAFRNTTYDALYSYMKATNEGSWRTAMANGMKKMKEYPDPQYNSLFYVFAITREAWMQEESGEPITASSDVDIRRSQP